MTTAETARRRGGCPASGEVSRAVVDATPSEAVLLLYLGVLATLLGYIFWNLGLKAVGPTRAVAYTYAASPLAVMFGALLLGEQVTVWPAIGGVLVVGGIAAAQGVSLARPSGTVARWRSARSHSAS